MNVFVPSSRVLSAGMDFPTPEWQLAGCITQANQLVTGLSPALRGLTSLHLTVRLILHDNPRPLCKLYSTIKDGKGHSTYQVGSCDMHIDGKWRPANPSQQIHTPALVNISRSVFEIVAKSVPNLHHLSLLGLCQDGVLRTFGSQCQKLHSLEVEASSVPFNTIAGFHTHLPSLSYFKLMKRGAYGNCLQTYVANAIAELGHCPSLASLDLDFGEKVQITCNLKTWQSLPESLVKLRSTSPLIGLRTHHHIFQSLNQLDLFRCPYDSICGLLQVSPNLQALTITGQASLLFQVSDLFSDELARPDDRILEDHLFNLNISCLNFLVRGTCSDMDTALSWLQPVSCTTVTLHVCKPTAIQRDLMRRVAMLFPDMCTLELSDQEAIVTPHLLLPSWYESCLRPLSLCTSLKVLLLRLPMFLTTAGLLKLCCHLPRLEKVRYVPCSGVNHKEFVQQLQIYKPDCQVVPF